MGGTTMAASTSGHQGPAGLLNLPLTPPSSAFLAPRAGAPPLVANSTPQQQKGLQQQLASLNGTRVQADIKNAINNLPLETVGPDQTAVNSVQVHGFTLVESSQNPVTGAPTSQAQHNLTLYDNLGGIVYVITYHDVFYWTGSHVTASTPYWTYWRAWYEFPIPLFRERHK